MTVPFSAVPYVVIGAIKMEIFKEEAVDGLVVFVFMTGLNDFGMILFMHHFIGLNIKGPVARRVDQMKGLVGLNGKDFTVFSQCRIPNRIDSFNFAVVDPFDEVICCVVAVTDKDNHFINNRKYGANRFDNRVLILHSVFDDSEPGYFHTLDLNRFKEQHFAQFMTNFIPIFPLEIVIFPREELHLHIFEPRYKQLIKECHEAGKPFGIPTVLKNQLQELGTLTEIREIAREYDNGEMDINTIGVAVFRTLEVIKQVPEKLYSGAIVNYPENELEDGNEKLMKFVVNGVREVHRMLNVNKDFKRPDDELRSYDIAHHAGLSLEEEYEFQGLFKELQRQEYLKRHLQKVLPMLVEMEQLKEKVKLNGHFRNLSPLDLNINPPTE